MGCNSIIDSHRYADTRQLLSSIMFVPAARLKGENLKSLKIDTLSSATYSKNPHKRTTIFQGQAGKCS